MKTLLNLGIAVLAIAYCQRNLLAEQPVPLLDAKYRSGYISPTSDTCGGFFVMPGCLDCIPRHYRQAGPHFTLRPSRELLGVSWYLGAQPCSSPEAHPYCEPQSMGH